MVREWETAPGFAGLYDFCEVLRKRLARRRERYYLDLMTTTNIKITYGNETITLACDLAQASAPLVDAETLRRVGERAAELGAEDYRCRADEVASGREAPEWCWPFAGADEAFLSAVGTRAVCHELGVDENAWDEISEAWLAGFARGYREARDLDRSSYVAAIGDDGTRPVVLGVGADEQRAARDVDEDQGEIACYAEVDAATYAKIRAGEVSCESLGISVVVRDGQIVDAELSA